MKINLFQNNSELLENLAAKIKSLISQKNFTLLKNKIIILTRETFTLEYLSMQLVKRDIPSLSFEILRLVDFLQEIREEFKQTKNIKQISPFEALVLLIQILRENSLFSSLNAKVLLKLAKELYQEYERDIDNANGRQCEKPYREILEKFKKDKRKFTENEILRQIISSKDLKIEDFECLKSKKDFPIILYGISFTTNLSWDLLQKIDEQLPLEFYFCKPAILSFEGSKLSNLSKFHILNRISNFEESNTSGFPSVFFYEAPEIHREVDFVAKSILGKIAENVNNSHLTRIKVIIPEESLYAIALRNTFEKFQIPFAFANDVYLKKQTAYYSAVYSLIQFVLSNFDKNIAIKLFQNPCFSPNIPSDIDEGVNYRIVIPSEHWVSIIQSLKLEEFLDGMHKKENGLLETSDLTWENLWRNASLASQGEIEGINLSEEVIQEIPNFIRITHSFLQDSFFLKQNNFKPQDFERFFKEFLTIYLDYEKRISEEEIYLEFQENVPESIYNNILKVLKEISKLPEEITLPSEILLNYLLERLEQFESTFSKVLRYGVVVGSFEDTNDIIFDFLYVLGVDEKRVPKRLAQKNLFDSDYAKNFYLHSKTNFYSIFHYSAKEIHISYVNRDSIGDKIIYPASTFNVLRNYFQTEPISIPLFNFLEPNLEQYKQLVLDRDSILTIWLKQQERELKIENIFPRWDKEYSKNEFIKAWESFEFKEKLLLHYFIPKLKSINFTLGEEIPLSRFLHYLDCPRKYFYKYTFKVEQEEDLKNELTEIQTINRINLQKSFFNILFTNPQERLENLLEHFKPLFEKYFLKKNLFTEIEWLKFIRRLKIPNTEKILHNILESEIFLNLRFKGKDYIQNNFPSGRLFEKEVSGKIDLVYKKAEKGFICKLVFANTISWKHTLELFLQTKSFSDVLTEKWKISNWNSHFIHVKKDWEIKIVPLEEHLETKHELEILKFLQDRWNEFTTDAEINFLAEPMKRKEKDEYTISSCSFCPFTKICPGYQFGYEDDSRWEKNSKILGLI